MQVSRARIFLRGFTLRCPNCGHRPIFSGLRLLRACPVCYMALQRGSGWWLGPWVINYGLVAFFLVIPLLALGLFGQIPMWLAMILAMLSALVFPFVFYRFTWSLWLMLYYLLMPEELPANNQGLDWIDRT